MLKICAGDPISAVRGLVARKIGAQFVEQFEYELIPTDPVTGRDVFEFQTIANKLVLRGNNGVSLVGQLMCGDFLSSLYCRLLRLDGT